MARAFRLISLAAAAIVGVVMSAGSAAAQGAAYPTKPIKLIIPYGAGGGADAAATVFVEKLSQKLGQPIVKEFRPGNNSVIGTAALASAPPDGYTLLLTTSQISTIPFLFSNVPFKTPEAFSTISVVTAYPFVMAVRSGLPFKDVKELVAYAKANPDKLTAGGAGAQLSLGLFNKLAGVKIREVPYKGAADALVAVAGGFIDMIFSGYETVRPYAESGHMKMLAQTGLEPFGAEEIPPIAKDVPGYEFLNWLALFAPAGTPKAVTDKIHAALTETFAEPDIKAKLAAQNITAVVSNSEQASAYVVKEIANSKAIIESMGLKPE